MENENKDQTPSKTNNKQNIFSNFKNLITILLSLVPLSAFYTFLSFTGKLIGLGYAQGKFAGNSLDHTHITFTDEMLKVYTFTFFSHNFPPLFMALALVALCLIFYFIVLLNILKYIEIKKWFGKLDLKVKRSYREKRNFIKKKRDLDIEKRTSKNLSVTVISLTLIIVLLLTIVFFLKLPHWAYGIGKTNSINEHKDYKPCTEKVEERNNICTCLYSENKLKFSGYLLTTDKDNVILFLGNGSIIHPKKDLLIKEISNGDACPATWDSAEKELSSPPKGDEST